MASSANFSASSSTGHRSVAVQVSAVRMLSESPSADYLETVESRAKVPGNQRCVLAVLCVSLFSCRSPLLADCNAISGSGLLVNRGMMLLNRLKKEKM